MALGLVVLMSFILVLFGVLIGCSLSERWLAARTRRQAEMQRSLNMQWRELQAARQEHYSARRRKRLELSRT